MENMSEAATKTKVSEIIANYRGFVNERAALQSVLYDVSLLPEQVSTFQDAVRLAAFCEVWKRGEEGKLSPAQSFAQEQNGLNVDTLAQEIRRVDGSHSLGAGALAEKLMPFIEKTCGGKTTR